jgi:hypothetical protein
VNSGSSWQCNGFDQWSVKWPIYLGD